jgi:hypothetical protein
MACTSATLACPSQDDMHPQHATMHTCACALPAVVQCAKPRDLAATQAQLATLLRPTLTQQLAHAVVCHSHEQLAFWCSLQLALSLAVESSCTTIPHRTVHTACSALLAGARPCQPQRSRLLCSSSKTSQHAQAPRHCSQSGMPSPAPLAHCTSPAAFCQLHAPRMLLLAGVRVCGM